MMYYGVETMEFAPIVELDMIDSGRVVSKVRGN